MSDPIPITDSLTERELDILRLMHAGLKSRQIAVRLMVEVSTVRWYIRQIYQKLNVHDRDDALRVAHHLKILPDPSIELPSNNLPAPTTAFIGRRDELAEIARLLADPDVRLITILAPGGMGKSHLALEAARQQIDCFADGAFFVPLAPLTSPDHIVGATAEAVGYPFQQDGRSPQQQILDFLSGKHLLLVLDNFEHLLDGAPLVTAMLEAAPYVQILVTSRERLRLHSETVFDLGGMVGLDEQDGGDAMQLFVESARRTHADFVLDESERPDVQRLCQLVGGMPLAIILAATWVELLPVTEIAAEVQRSLDILEAGIRDMPARHQSIRALFDLTWESLDTHERETFANMAVFRGGCTRQAAQALTGASLPMLQILVDKALIRPRADYRYGIHELLRQYAEEKLTDSAAAYAQHSRYYLNWLASLEADIKGRRQRDALDDIEADFDNVRAAWLNAVERGDDKTIGTALEALFWFCDMRSRPQEDAELIRLAQAAFAPLGGLLWERLLACTDFSDRDAVAHIERVFHIVCELDDPRVLAFVLLRMGQLNHSISQNLDHHEYAISCCQHSIDICQTINEPFFLARAYNQMAVCWTHLGEFASTQRAAQTALEIARQNGDVSEEAIALCFYGDALSGGSHFHEMEDAYQQAYALAYKVGNRLNAAYIAGWSLAGAKAYSGDLASAEKLAMSLLMTAVKLNVPGLIGRARLILSWVAMVHEDYTTCRIQAQEGYRLVSPIPSCVFAWIYLGAADYASGDFALAAQHAIRFFAYCYRIRYLPGMYMALPVLAGLLAQQGHPDDAAALLALALTHPNSPQGMMRVWGLVSRLRSTLRAELGDDAFEAAWSRGRDLTLDEALALALSHPDSPQGTTAPQPVVSRLVSRE